MSVSIPAEVKFLDQSLSIIEHNGAPWLAAADLARALGYANANAVSRIFARHKGEFTDGMTGEVKLTLPNQRRPVPVRIFSPRGCHLVAMFAHTSRAAAFRRWVLDVLEGLAKPAPVAQEAPGPVEILPPIPGMITEPAKGLLAGHLLALLERFGAMPQVMDELERYGQLPVPQETQEQLALLKMQTRNMARESNRLAMVAEQLARGCLGLRDQPLPRHARQALADKAIADIKRMLDISDV